ncbi:TPA: hypothetical protein N5N39_000368 [Enterobacter cloacae subsp. cloacae]|uniref:hypothetical protein n=1 Tax=Enterobacter cloacae TaxID=550 RepID=UPI0018C318BB|nr:hypothetical protein [Enterobacter cloacae]MBG0521258.1 hypothetical protein [Enterobacter cloacae]HCM9440019.1 hypothetical protein [Enterobacter cloacae subsp. cloacae]
MTTHNVTVTVNTNAQSFEEVNEEISRLKLVIGVLLAKFPPELRNNAINDIKSFGLTEAAELFEQFNPKSE